MRISIEIPVVLVCHMAKTIQPLELVVWSNTRPPKQNWAILLSGLTTWFLVVKAFKTCLLVLIVLNWKLKFHGYIDASNFALGTMLGQNQDNITHKTI